MDGTSLTVGGFNQPAVARLLIELPGNAEKGLSQRFLWLYPQPVYGKFDTLEPVRKEFLDKIGKHRSILSFFTNDTPCRGLDMTLSFACINSPNSGSTMETGDTRDTFGAKSFFLT